MTLTPASVFYALVRLSPNYPLKACQDPEHPLSGVSCWFCSVNKVWEGDTIALLGAVYWIYGVEIGASLLACAFCFSCQDPKVDDFFASYSFGVKYKFARDGTIAPSGLIF